MMGIASVAAITVICYLVGIGAKATAMKNDYIPVVCGVCGALLGIVAYFIKMPDFPAQDVITAVAVGIVSGLAATGINEIKKIGGNNGNI